MFSSLQQQFMAYWKRQSLGKQITMVSLILAAAILIPVLINWANTPSYSVAYSGLSETDAAQIVKKLDENNISYQIKNSGTIMVPSDQVYSVRLLMAGDGLPASTTVGYELFSGSSTLGMTEFSQQVNYQRAIEGELERTIGSLDAVKAVRVHLVLPEKSLLSSDQPLTTASVTIQVNPGRTLDSNQVRSITHLVASSVEGLKPENVVVVDTQGNMLADGTGSNEADLSQKDDQRAAEQAYDAEVQKRVQNILDKILGPNHSVVQAAVEMDWTQRDVTSNMYEPTAVAIRSSQKVNETSTNGGTSTGGVPGAASNLPTPVATTTASANGSSYQRSEETLNYEVSQVQSHEITAPGKVSRLSVSVMVDNITDQAQLDVIKSAVQAAAGIDSTRGDQIVVQSYKFDTTTTDALAADLAQQQKQQQMIQIALISGAVLILLVLFFFIFRTVNNLRNASKESWTPVLRSVSEMVALQGGYYSPALPQANMNAAALPAARTATPQAAPKTENEDVVVQLRSRSQSATATEDEQRARIISRLTEENPATVAEIIQVWLNEGKKS